VDASLAAKAAMEIVENQRTLRTKTIYRSYVPTLCLFFDSTKVYVLHVP
jgi:hypothetical protein